jgi:hypothetical protein
MPLDPKVDIAAQLALALAGIYLDPSDKTTSLLAALFGAVKSFNESNGLPADYVPTKEEWEAEALAREAKRIDPR